jgi:hypothetical protein
VSRIGFITAQRTRAHDLKIAGVLARKQGEGEAENE